jgi:hypothetical protein
MPMSAKLVFGPRSRRRLYAVRRLKVVEGILVRGPFLAVYQARSAEAALRAARRDFPACKREPLAAVDQVASLRAMSGETLVFPASIHTPDGTLRRVLLSHPLPDRAFRGIRVAPDPAAGHLHSASEDAVE